jgi:hypothetical protein
MAVDGDVVEQRLSHIRELLQDLDGIGGVDENRLSLTRF